MVTTRRSLGTPSNNAIPPRKRRSIDDSSLPFKKVYPDLAATTSYASTACEQTLEIADDEEEYETEHDTSFNSSRASETPESGDSQKWKYALVAAAVIIAAILVGFLIRGKNVQNNNPSYVKYINSVREVISTRFFDLSQENRAILRLIGQKVYLEPDNAAPLVILVGGVNGRQFSEAISGIVRSTTTENADNSAKHESIRVEKDTNRAELHEILRNALSPASPSSPTPSPRTAVVLDVDLLKWDAVLVLHAFADHEMYPVPKTVLFLTVSSEDENESYDKMNCDEKMVGFLTSRWIENGGSSDNIPPIIARISYFICV